MANYGVLGQQKFKLQGSKWIPDGEEELEAGILDRSHYDDWARLDKVLGAKARVVPLSMGGSAIHQYITTSPTGTERVVYTRKPTAIVGDIDEARKLLDEYRKAHPSQVKPLVFGNDLRIKK